MKTRIEALGRDGLPAGSQRQDKKPLLAECGEREVQGVTFFSGQNNRWYEKLILIPG
jgi:hypothetical protein